MADTEKPILHGRDHRLGGSDPIPFPISKLPLAYVVSGTTFTPAADATLHFPSWTGFETTDDTVFSWPSGGTATKVGAIEGTYLVGYFVAAASVPTSPDSLKVSVTWQQTGGGTNDFGLIENQISVNSSLIDWILHSTIVPEWSALQIISQNRTGTFQLAFEKDSGSTFSFTGMSMLMCRLGDPVV